MVVSLALVAAPPLRAQTDRTPNLGTSVPAGWAVDRYPPCQFRTADNADGRDSLTQIGICTADDQSNRSGVFGGLFYNSRGIRSTIDVVGAVAPASQRLLLDLFADRDRATNANGNVAASLWSRVDQVGSDDEASASYPISGFSNAYGTGAFRFWDSMLGWQTLSSPVTYSAWNAPETDYAGNVFTAVMNGAPQYTEGGDPGTVRLTSAFVEDYNFGDTNAPDRGEYTASWSNAPVVATPEPASLALIATGLAALAVVGHRRRQAQRNLPKHNNTRENSLQNARYNLGKKR